MILKLHSRVLTALVSAGLVLLASHAQATLLDFNLAAFNGYINTPSFNSGTGTLTFSNTNPRPPGSQAYQTGVGVTNMPSYSAGEILQRAILMRSTDAASFLNIGVQSGSGDTNTLSVTNELLATNSSFLWVYSIPRLVDAFKPNGYFWIPGAIGQEIQVQRILLGDPASIIRAVPESAAGLPVFAVVTVGLLLLRGRVGRAI